MPVWFLMSPPGRTPSFCPSLQMEEQFLPGLLLGAHPVVLDIAVLECELAMWEEKMQELMTTWPVPPVWAPLSNCFLICPLSYLQSAWVYPVILSRLLIKMSQREMALCVHISTRSWKDYLISGTLRGGNTNFHGLETGEEVKWA